MSYSLARYVATTAPGGLALVQGLLNTRANASGATDLLAELDTAQDWLDDGLAQWSALTDLAPEHIQLSPARLRDLRALRSRVRAYVSGDRTDAGLDVPISIVSTADGVLRTQPTGTGVAWLASAIWGAVLVAQQADTLRRLKLCRNEVCDSAFYDRSKNSSGVWHDVHVCGNAANLRASRARRKMVA
jgi:predicted RNA-binding Zn ribbon-like protein